MSTCSLNPPDSISLMIAGAAASCTVLEAPVALSTAACRTSALSHLSCTNVYPAHSAGCSEVLETMLQPNFSAKVAFSPAAVAPPTTYAIS